MLENNNKNLICEIENFKGWDYVALPHSFNDIMIYYTLKF